MYFNARNRDVYNQQTLKIFDFDNLGREKFRFTYSVSKQSKSLLLLHERFIIVLHKTWFLIKKFANSIQLRDTWGWGTSDVIWHLKGTIGRFSITFPLEKKLSFEPSFQIPPPLFVLMSEVEKVWICNFKMPTAISHWKHQFPSDHWS